LPRALFQKIPWISSVKLLILKMAPEQKRPRFLLGSRRSVARVFPLRPAANAVSKADISRFDFRKASGAAHPLAERLSFRLIDFKSFIRRSNVGIARDAAGKPANHQRSILRQKTHAGPVPNPSGAGRARTGLGRRRPDHAHAHRTRE
jgi:hypothetical protein